MEVQSIHKQAPGNFPGETAPSQAPPPLPSAKPIDPSRLAKEFQQCRRKVSEALDKVALEGDLKVKVSRDEATGRGVVRIYSADGRRQLGQFPPPEVLKLPETLHDFAGAGEGRLLETWA